jgi:hypothetical protein
MKSALVPGALALAALAACGGDDGGGGGIHVPDGGGSNSIDAPSAPACAAMSDYGSPTPTMGGALRFCIDTQMQKLVKCPTATTANITGTATDPPFAVFLAQLNANNDYFQFEMWKGSPPFMTKIQPASNISFADATQSQWKTCAACAYVSAQVNTQTGADMGTYLANAGTGNLTTVTLVNDQTMTKLTGNVSNLVMPHVDIAMDGTSTASADGCSTKLTSLSFDTTIKDPAAMLVSDAFYNRIAARATAKFLR